MAVATAVAAVALTGCGADDDGPSVAKANERLRTTSFHSSGGTTAFAGGSQETWWDPAQGFRLKAGWADGSGEIYCRDGTTYTSASILADAMRQQGRTVELPAGLAEMFVTSKLPDGRGCDTYFTIPEQAERSPGQDRISLGKATRAFALTAAPGASDTYYVESATSRLVQLESARNGRFSTTAYDSFGASFTIEMPRDVRTISMEAFRGRVGGGV